MQAEGNPDGKAACFDLTPVLARCPLWRRHDLKALQAAGRLTPEQLERLCRADELGKEQAGWIKRFFGCEVASLVTS